MTIVERRLLARFAATAAKVLLVLAWLAAAIHLPRIVDLADEWDPDRALSLALRFFAFVEIALVFAAPLAIVATVLDVKGSGLLTTLLVSGLEGRHLRRVFAVAAVGTVLVAAVAMEATTAVRSAYLVRRQRRASFVARDGERLLWVFDRIDRELLGGDRRALVFDARSLDVAMVDRVEGTASEGVLTLSAPRGLAGEPRPGDRAFRAAGGALDAFLPPASAWWPLRATLSWLNRATLAGVVLVLAGYAALLAPLARPRSVFLALVWIFPAAGLAAFWCTTALWTHERLGVAYEAGWIALVLGATYLLDRAFARRGLRAA